MGQYIGLDVSLKDTAISIREDGKTIWRGKCPSDPGIIAQAVRKHADDPLSVVFETGPLATWFFHALTGEGLRAICIEARHAQTILGETLNKTDANDAEGLAKLGETGFYKAVRVKSFEAMLIRSLVAARTQLLAITTQLTNQIRGFDEDFRSCRAQEQRPGVHRKGYRSIGRTCRVERDHLSAARSLASCQGAGVYAQTPALVGGATVPKHAIAHDDTRHRGDHSSFLCGRYRRPKELSEVPVCRRMAWPHHTPIPIERDGF